MAANPYEKFDVIRKLRARGIREADIDDEDLLEVIEDSLNEYLAYRPKVCITGHASCITTVADTPSYDKPTGALWIIDVLWHPDYSDDFMSDLYTEIVLGMWEESDVSIITLDHLRMARLHSLFNGSWTIRDDKIWLIPCPGDAYHVAVIYAASRTLDELDMIADFRFMDLCYYKAMFATGTSKLTGGGWRAGSYSVSESVGRETIKFADAGLTKTRLLLSQGVPMVRS